MRKNLKLYITIATSLAMLGYWAALWFTHTKYEMINYWWQAFLAAISILYGIFGIAVARHWSGLKSGVGRGILSISLGVVMWGVGQAGWTYAVIKDPAQQSPPSNLISILYFTSIPLWTYGIFQLSRATGARYGLRSAKAKIMVLLTTAVMFAVSYVVLVNIARGGSAYFHSDTVLNIFFDLGYAAGDAINLILATVIFGLSWKYLGGRFKRPILIILLAFALIYLADFWFSYRDGQSLYYNGDWTDLLYLLMVAVFGVGLCLLDPRKEVAASAEAAAPVPTSTTSPLAPTTPAPAPVSQPVSSSVPQADMPSLSSEPADPPQHDGGGQ